MKKNLNKKALSAAGLGAALLLSATFAYFTDRANYSEDITGAKFGITLTAESDNSTVIMPDHARAFNYTVESTGTVDADIRERVMVYGQDGDQYLPVNADTQEFGLYNEEDNADLYTKKTVGKEAVLYENTRELKAGQNYTQNGNIKLNASATNVYSDGNYTIAILVEAKQKGASEWTTVAAEEINMAGENKADMQDTLNKVNAVAKGQELKVGGN